jgi:aryl-alcohol dehydrogenase-like predicted oxidoreductase
MGFDRIISNQPQYSMLYRVIEERVIPTCETYGIGQIVWSPMAQGVLSGKYLPGQPPPPGSRATDKSGSTFIKRLLSDPILEAVQRLRPIAEGHGLSMGQLALAWVLSNPNVSAAIAGASRPEQIEDNAKASGVTLTDDVLAAIDAAIGAVVIRDPALTESPPRRPTPEERS